MGKKVKVSLALLCLWCLFLAGCDQKAITVTFECNGGSLLPQNTVINLSVSAIPTKEGYLFLGWYTDKALTQSFTFDQIPAGDITLYAKWMVNQYTLSFDSKGGSAIPSLMQDYGTVITLPDAPIKAGYTFDGWYTDEALTQIYIFDKMPAENMTLYAKWHMNQYTLNFNSNGGSAVPSLTQDYGIVVTLPEAPTKTGSTFDGWYTDEGLTQAYAFDEIPAENMTLYAKWHMNQYTLTFNSNGGSVVSPITANFNAAITAPVIPAKAGYIFGGWYSDEGLTQAYTIDKMPAQPITLYAKWYIHPFTITFDSNEGSAVPPIWEDYNTPISAPGIPTKAGYTFKGWYGDEALTQAYTFVKMPSQNITLYAKWIVNSYTISFNSHGGSTVDAVTQNYDSDVDQPAPPAKTGYTFGGWYRDEDLTQVYLFDKMPCENIMLRAKWIANLYTITFNSNGGSVISGTTQNYNTDVTEPTPPVKTGYAFNGWYSDGGLSQAYVFDKMPSQNITLYAKWTANSYTITFNSNGGNTIGSMTQDYGSDVTAPSPPTKTGSTFSGWYADEELTQAYAFDKMPAYPMTLYAKWSANPYTISFICNGGTTVAPLIGDYQTAVTEPVAPTKTGHTFGGWFRDEAFLQAYTFDKMPAENITLYAKWTVNQYTITFSGNEFNAIVQDYGSDVAEPVAPTKTGHSFGGWFGDEAFTQAYTFNTMPAVNITLYAKWTVNQYTITFNGNEVNAITQDYDSDVVVPATPIKDGYIFKGWYRDASFAQPYTFGRMPAENITLYGKWQCIFTYTVNGTDATITGLTGTPPATMVIPAILDGYTVIGIAEEAFLNQTAITSVTLPTSVITIGKGAFKGCSHLTSINIPRSVTAIYREAFSGCTGLTSIFIPDSVVTMKDLVFLNWTANQTIYIEAINKPAGWIAFWYSGCSANIVWGYTGV